MVILFRLCVSFCTTFSVFFYVFFSVLFEVSSKVSILVFHHKDVHALPNQASDRVLTEPEFKELGGIFDIAFLADKGIYACDMNRATAVGIEKFLITQSQVMTLSR